GDGIFSRALTTKTEKSWDGGIIIFNATDLDGHSSSTRLVLQVGRGSGSTETFSGSTWNSTLGGIGQGDSGPEGDYGYNIYDEAGLPTPTNPGGTPQRIFLPGETVYVIARSTMIQNLENINSFILRDSSGLKLYPPTKEFDSRDVTKTDPAFNQTATYPYFEYQYQFTAPILIGSYSVEFTLKDNAGHASFFATDMIWVSTNGTAAAYPKILTYRDPNGDGDLSDLVAETAFNSTENVYVRAFFQDLDLDAGTCTPWFPTSTCPVYVNDNAGDVEVLDYYGALQVKKRPGNSPVSKISTFAYDQGTEKSYVFYINLLKREQDPWIPGTNFYTLRIRSISDSGYGSTTAEGYQMLSTQIEVTAPMSTIDIVGSTEQGTGDDDRGVYWYQNTFYWQEHPIDLLPKDVKKPLAMATGDLNGDTKIDVVIGLDAKEVTNIVAYLNLDYGTNWRREFINQFQGDDNYRAESLAIGDLDGDGDGDLIAGIRDTGGAGVGVIVFWNDGVWSTQVLQYSQSGNVPPVRSLAIGDINNDGRPDIVAGDKDGRVDYYCNNVRGSFLAGSTVPCPLKTSLEPPGDADSFSQGVEVGKAFEILHNSLRLGKMEGMSETDDTLDIVVSNDKDLIIYRTSVTNGVATFTRYDVLQTGDTIDRRIQSLAVGDMSNDGMIDIVVGVDSPGKTSGVYRLRNMGMTSGSNPTFNPWESKLLPHTTTNPKDGKIADLGKVKDLALGDTDADGDLDIVFISDVEDEFLNNMWHLENVGDDPTAYVETNVFTDGWFERREKAFAVELDFIDL
ncbi:MAG: FG-GAP-like repeat-containing protein, partial [Candidatus Geothermarchaeales archaeon]